jgi:hypothetical protein
MIKVVYTEYPNIIEATIYSGDDNGTNMVRNGTLRFTPEEFKKFDAALYMADSEGAVWYAKEEAGSTRKRPT